MEKLEPLEELAKQSFLRFFCGNDDGMFRIFFEDEGSNSFLLNAYAISDNMTLHKAGLHHAILCPNGLEHPTTFLRMPMKEKPYFRTGLFISPEYQKQGLGTRLFELMANEIHIREGFHVVGFTANGYSYIRKRCLELGYMKCRENGNELPMWASGLIEFMYKEF